VQRSRQRDRRLQHPRRLGVLRQFNIGKSDGFPQLQLGLRRDLRSSFSIRAAALSIISLSMVMSRPRATLGPAPWSVLLMNSAIFSALSRWASAVLRWSASAFCASSAASSGISVLARLGFVVAGLHRFVQA